MDESCLGGEPSVSLSEVGLNESSEKSWTVFERLIDGLSAQAIDEPDVATSVKHTHGNPRNGSFSVAGACAAVSEGGESSEVYLSIEGEPSEPHGELRFSLSEAVPK